MSLNANPVFPDTGNNPYSFVNAATGVDGNGKTLFMAARAPFAPSGATPVSGQLTSSNPESMVFTPPQAGRDFHIVLYFASNTSPNVVTSATGNPLGTTVTLLRSTDNGANFLPINGDGVQLCQFTLTGDEKYNDDLSGAQFMVVASPAPASNSPISYRFCQ